MGILDRLGNIRLRCPDCKSTADVPKERWDPPRAAIAEIHCPECSTRYHQPLTYYFDANDVQLTDEECMDAADMASLHVNRETGEA